MADGFASGGRGITYEYRMCMLCLVRGYTKGLKEFQLRYQVSESEVGKFDDIVFDEGDGKYQVHQLKHKEKGGNSKLSSSQLFHAEKFDADFNLLKFVTSYIRTLKDKVKMAVVLTPADFNTNKHQFKLLDDSKGWFQGSEFILLHPLTPEEKAIIHTSTSFPNSKCYKFYKDPDRDEAHPIPALPNTNDTIVHILKRQSETVSKELRQILEQKQTTPNKKYENQQKQLKEKDKALANFLENLKEEDIREALQHIVYAVRQPNDMQLEEIIKKEIKDYFKLQNANTVYNALENAILNWCNTKEPIVAEMCNPHHVIQFSHTETFFQQYVKEISFGDNAPISSFAGRLDELESIRKYFSEEQGDSIAIIGVGGIGKTELTKQFIKEFVQSDFYGRVIWIEAESDEMVKMSFRALAEKLDIQNIENKLTTTIIDQIFDYFNEVKVLFVFDNFDKSFEYTDETNYTGESSNDNEKNFVIHYLKNARGPTKKHPPYFIFTSRNRVCFPGVFSLDLSVFTKEEANKLIIKELTNKNYTDHDVEELTEALQYFPLALQKAIASINSVSGGDYNIQKYLTELKEKKEKLLTYPYEYDLMMNMMPKMKKR